MAKMWVFNATTNHWQPLVGDGAGGDHGELTGLEDDDHPQYLTRIDASATYAHAGHRHDHPLDLSPYGDSVYLRPQNIKPGANITITDPGDGTIIIGSTGGGAGANEVSVSPGEPVASEAEIWIDTDATGSFQALPQASGGVTDHGQLTGLVDDDHPQYVLNTGDTITGPVTLTGGTGLKHAPSAGLGPAQLSAISTDNTASLLTDAPAGKLQGLIMATRGSIRWMVGTDALGEGGSNTGTNFTIARYADNGTTRIGIPLSINRDDGEVSVAADPITDLGVATKRYTDAKVIDGVGSSTTSASSQKAMKDYVDAKMLVSDDPASGVYPVNTVWIEY